MKKRIWIAASGLVILLSGALLLYAGLYYNPLVFVVEDQALRKAEWIEMRPSVFAGVGYSQEEEHNLLERRSLEELVLYKGRQIGISADETFVEQQLLQLGATPDERASVLKEMNMTEEDAKNNYRRALTGFELKKRITQDVKVTDEEILAYYNTNKEAFYVPEFRTIRYLRAKADDAATRSRLHGVSAEQFQSVIEEFPIDPDGRVHSWEELTSQGTFAQNTSEVLAEAAFQAPKDQVTGPIQDGAWIYWVVIEDVTTAYQQTYPEVRKKINELLYQDKQTTQFRTWMEAQKESSGYGLYKENLTASRWDAFWKDLPQNIRLLF
ncbi:peptidyl-prolyl cis-trans isomerase [Tumebacillus algifaecis]|nr:peptidyl-prolyl cis-trans isomerase [Tumebacillus algifaecis]